VLSCFARYETKQATAHNRTKATELDGILSEIDVFVRAARSITIYLRRSSLDFDTSCQNMPSIRLTKKLNIHAPSQAPAFHSRGPTSLHDSANSGRRLPQTTKP